MAREAERDVGRDAPAPLLLTGEIDSREFLRELPRDKDSIRAIIPETAAEAEEAGTEDRPVEESAEGSGELRSDVAMARW